MDKKTIALVVVLGIILLFYFQIMEFLGLYKPAIPKQAVQTDIDTVSQQYQPPAASATIIDSNYITSEQLISESNLDTTSLTYDTIVVVTEKYQFTLTSFGGGPVSILLNEYYYRDGNLIEMMPGKNLAAPEAIFAGGTFSASKVNYLSNLQPGKYKVTSQPLDLIYTYESAQGGIIKKQYRFYPDSYHFDIIFEIENRDLLGFERQYNFVWNAPPGVTEPQPDIDYSAMEVVAMQSGSRETLNDYEENKLNQSLTGSTAWGGVRSKYFASVIIPKNREADGVFGFGEKRNVTTPDGKYEQKELIVGLDMPFANVPALTDTFTVFVGPLDYNLLAKYNVGLEDMLGIGTTPFVGWLIKPFAIAIIWLLPKMYSVLPNYGLVIILFALLVKLVTLPLSMKSFKSMNAMKELQPKIEDLKKKHKNNPQALNSEMMKMYKAHGVNPMSGCLPMLPQMPLFFALFSVFRSTILLRDAPFIWFINDLSRGASSFTDPYIILVVLMIASQFISQKLTMATSQQNKAFLYIMPVFMGFIFYKFAAGLVLYWTCFSVFSLLDYFLFKRNKNTEIKTA